MVKFKAALYYFVMASFVFSCVALLVVVQSLDVKLEKRKDNKYDMLITGFDIGQFNLLPGDPEGENVLRIEPGRDLCTGAELTNTGESPTRFDVECGQLSRYEGMDSFETVQKQITEILIPLMFEHKVAIKEHRLRNNNELRWRLIVPKLSGEPHPELEDIVVKWENGVRQEEGFRKKVDELIISHFDEKRAGLKDSPTKTWGYRYAAESVDPSLKVDKKGPVLYFYEAEMHSYKKYTFGQKHQWAPYIYQKMHSIIDPRTRKQTNGVLFRFKKRDSYKTKTLTLKDFVSVANEERIAFDPKGEFLLTGKKKANPGKKRVRKVKFDLSDARDEMYGDIDVYDGDDDDRYYDEFYYEEIPRLLRTAQKLNYVYRN
eukprot:126169_1